MNIPHKVRASPSKVLSFISRCLNLLVYGPSITCVAVFLSHIFLIERFSRSRFWGLSFVQEKMMENQRESSFCELFQVHRFWGIPWMKTRQDSFVEFLLLSRIQNHAQNELLLRRQSRLPSVSPS
jgi:hypothetical protein